VAFWKHHDNSAAYLASIGFFAGFSHDDLTRVVALGKESEAPRGTLLMDQGEVGEICYVIVDGAASIYVNGEYFATLTAGAMVGEMALLDHRPRRATVVADTDLKLLGFNARRFRQLLDEMPKARDGVLALLASRLRPDDRG
jgi:CRP-like cAMP-binding protein